MSKSSPPPAPDYTGAAQATAAGNLAAAQATTAANRVNQITPNGSLTYAQTGTDSQGNPMWTSTQTQSPAQKAIADQNNALSLQYGNIAQQGINAISPMLSNPNLDTSAMPAMPQNAGTTSQQVIMSRLQPQIDRQNQMSDASLANQGITQGSEAYRNAKTDLGNNQNDLLTQAAGQGVTMDMNARNQYIANQSAIQNQPLNVVNALRTGAQVQNPTFNNVPQQQGVAGPDLLGASNANSQYNQGLYNSQTAGNNAMIGGLATIAGGMMGGPVGAAIGSQIAGSDPCIKENIAKVGEFNGMNIYAYEYKPEYRNKWGHGLKFGVMADEIENIYPDAVTVCEDGYRVVDYAKLGV